MQGSHMAYIYLVAKLEKNLSDYVFLLLPDKN